MTETAIERIYSIAENEVKGYFHYVISHKITSFFQHQGFHRSKNFGLSRQKLWESQECATGYLGRFFHVTLTKTRLAKNSSEIDFSAKKLKKFRELYFWRNQIFINFVLYYLLIPICVLIVKFFVKKLLDMPKNSS